MRKSNRFNLSNLSNGLVATGEVLLTVAVMTAIEVLQNDFEFTKEQSDDFSQKHLAKIKERLNLIKGDGK